MSSQADPLFLSPALPTELLWHIIHYCTFPSTLVVCARRHEFLSSVTQQIRHQESQAGAHDFTRPEEADGVRNEEQPRPPHVDTRAVQLLAAAPLYQVAVARHIRVVFIPTVSHLRAFLSVFSMDDSKVSAPPSSAHDVPASRKPPSLLIYGFLDLHRDTSEWSVQGVSNTAAVLVETAKRLAFQAVAVEPRTLGAEVSMDEMLAERMPILSGSARRTGPDFEGSGWTGRTVDARRVLGRWFRFQSGDWE